MQSFVIFSGERGLEIRGNGDGSTLFVDFHRRSASRVGRNHSAGSCLVWHACCYRRGVERDRGRHGQASFRDPRKGQYLHLRYINLQVTLVANKTQYRIVNKPAHIFQFLNQKVFFISILTRFWIFFFFKAKLRSLDDTKMSLFLLKRSVCCQVSWYVLEDKLKYHSIHAFEKMIEKKGN